MLWRVCTLQRRHRIRRHIPGGVRRLHRSGAVIPKSSRVLGSVSSESATAALSRPRQTPLPPTATASVATLKDILSYLERSAAKYVAAGRARRENIAGLSPMQDSIRSEFYYQQPSAHSWAQHRWGLFYHLQAISPAPSLPSKTPCSNVHVKLPSPSSHAGDDQHHLTSNCVMWQHRRSPRPAQRPDRDNGSGKQPRCHPPSHAVMHPGWSRACDPRSQRHARPTSMAMSRPCWEA